MLIETATKKPITCDVCIVGSGASGGMAAKELAERGLDVVILEAGGYIKPSQFLGHDMPWQVPRRGLRWSPRDPFQVDRNKHPVVNVGDAPHNGLLEFHAVGGRSLFWASHSWRFSPYDFKAASRDGAGEDWPLSYADLAPYYDRVERFIGVTGKVENHPNVPDGSFLPPLPLRCGEWLLKRACERLGYKPVHTRKAVLTKNYANRPACHWCGNCMAGCDSDSKYTSANGAVPAALATRRARLITNAFVTSLVTDETGKRVREVQYTDRQTGRQQTVEARAVVMAAGAIQTARLLLHCQSARHPHGLANRNKLIGKNLMTHMGTGVGGHLRKLVGTEVVNDDGSETNHLSLVSWYYEKRHPKFVRGYLINLQTGVGRGAGYARHVEGFGSDFKRCVRAIYPAQVGFHIQGEMLTHEDNFVDLDPNAKDLFGIPAPRIHFNYHENERQMFLDMREKAAEIIHAADGEAWPLPESFGHDTTHYVGTCKMGNNPATSVTDPWGRTHAVENLWVVDGGLFVSNPEKNPTLTIMALALRAAERLARELGST